VVCVKSKFKSRSDRFEAGILPRLSFFPSILCSHWCTGSVFLWILFPLARNASISVETGMGTQVSFLRNCNSNHEIRKLLCYLEYSRILYPSILSVCLYTLDIECSFWEILKNIS